MDFCLGISIIRESFWFVDSSANNESPMQHPRIFLLFWVHLGQAGLDPKPEIMVPVVSTAKELRLIVPRIEAAVADELKKANVEVGQVLRVRCCSRIRVYEYVVFGLDARYYCEGGRHSLAASSLRLYERYARGLRGVFSTNYWYAQVLGECACSSLQGGGCCCCC